MTATILDFGIAELIRTHHFLTDKTSAHSYDRFYDTLFTALGTEKLCLVELGIAEGGSLQLWDALCTESLIIGIDLQKPSTLLTEEMHQNTCTLLQQNIYHDVTPLTLAAVLHNTRISLLIDDALHSVAAQLRALTLYWPLVMPGGYYVVEDIQFQRDYAILTEYLAWLAPTAHIAQFDERHVPGKVADNMALVIHKGQ